MILQQTMERPHSVRNTHCEESSEQPLIICFGESGRKVAFTSESSDTKSNQSSRQVMGRDISTLFGPETAPEAIAMLNYLMKNCVAGRVVLLAYFNSSTPSWFSFYIRPLKSRASNANRFLLLISPTED